MKVARIRTKTDGVIYSRIIVDPEENWKLKFYLLLRGYTTTCLLGIKVWTLPNNNQRFIEEWNIDRKLVRGV